MSRERSSPEPIGTIPSLVDMAFAKHTINDTVANPTSHTTTANRRCNRR